MKGTLVCLCFHYVVFSNDNSQVSLRPSTDYKHVGIISLQLISDKSKNPNRLCHLAFGLYSSILTQINPIMHCDKSENYILYNNNDYDNDNDNNDNDNIIMIIIMMMMMMMMMLMIMIMMMMMMMMIMIIIINNDNGSDNDNGNAMAIAITITTSLLHHRCRWFVWSTSVRNGGRSVWYNSLSMVRDKYS